MPGARGSRPTHSRRPSSSLCPFAARWGRGLRRGETHVLTQQRAVGDGVFCARLVELERREGGAVAMLLEVLPHERLCDQVRVHAAAPLHCPHRQGAPVAAQSGRTQSGLRCTRERSLARSTPLSVQQRCGASRVSKRAVTKGARVEPYERVIAALEEHIFLYTWPLRS